VPRLAQAHPGATWVCPLGLADALRALGVREPVELDWWQGRQVETPGGVADVTAIPAQHFSGRVPWDRNRSLWCGFAVGAGALRMMFAGDTGLHPEFGRIGAECGPFDLALMPIGAYDPRWFMRPVHLDPEEAVAAYDALTGGAVHSSCALVPIHWGTFRLTDEPMAEPPARLEAEWRRRGLPDRNLFLLRHGESRGRALRQAARAP
jgi:N-acyl-phosphatidylethanolamine-hydrolysing phospholipase D